MFQAEFPNDVYPRLQPCVIELDACVIVYEGWTLDGVPYERLRRGCGITEDFKPKEPGHWYNLTTYLPQPYDEVIMYYIF